MNAIVVGPDPEGIATALQDRGTTVTTITDVATGEKLDEAGIGEADLLVLTDVGQATTVPIARDRNDALRIVVYDRQSIPEFIRGAVDLAVDPGLLDPAAVAEELVDE